MADVLRRSPQGEDPTQAIQGPAEQTSVMLGDFVATAAPTTDLAATDAIVVTTIGTNNDGQEWTSFDTIVPSTSLFTEPSATTRAVATFSTGPDVNPVDGCHTPLSKGAIAGIAVATAVIGACIAFMITWSLFKRRDKKFIQKTCPSGYPIYGDSSPELLLAQKSAALEGTYGQMQMRTPVPVPSRLPVGDPLAGILPPAATESEVQNRVAALFEQMHRHVDTFYRDVHASITPSMESDLAAFGKNVDMLQLLQSCLKPTVTLKHALVAYILSVTAPKQCNGAEQTLWPAELAQMLRTDESNPPHLSPAQALHRRLSIFLYTQHSLLTPTRPHSHLSNLSSLSLPRATSSAICTAAEQFSLTFFPWANPALSENEREADLAGIIAEVLEARIWMMGQSLEWGFDWEEPGRGAVVLSPGLVVREGRGPWRGVLGQKVEGF